MRENISNSRRRVLACASALALAGVLPSTAMGAEQDWPTRPVKIVIAQAAGSSTDLLARIVAPRLETIWKQPVIVENKPGAGGMIGTEYTIASKDAHTFLLATQSSYLPKFTRKDLRYDPSTDLIPVYRMIDHQIVVVTNAETAKQAKSFLELVNLSKTKDFFFSGTGQTSALNITMALTSRPYGMKYTTVDFNTIPAMNLAVLRNDAQLLVNTWSSVRSHFDSGALVPILAVSKQRYPGLPNVPAMGELPGFKGFLPIVWNGMVAPKGTPQYAIDRFARDLEFVLHSPDVKNQIEMQLSGSVQQSSPAAFAKQLREEAQVWRDLFKTMNVKLE